jgi:predicted aspartyl protease
MPIRRFSQIVLLLICASNLHATATAAPAPTEVTARIKIVNDYLIVVPITINGSGPYDFLLDTGSNNTILDQKLGDDLALPHGKATTIFGANGSMSLSSVYADSLSMAAATVDGKALSLFSSANLRSLPRKVRGILGEDFLQNFDILIDYRRQIIQLEPGLGPLAQTLAGEHLPIQLSGTRQGKPTFGRLILIGRIDELGDNPVSLLLDSGANNLTLFRETLGPGSNRRGFVDAGTFKSSGITLMETKTVRRLNLGRNEVNDLTVIGVAGKREHDVDGLIPISLFHSIFISHQGRFVILNPTLPKESH